MKTFNTKLIDKHMQLSNSKFITKFKKGFFYLLFLSFIISFKLSNAQQLNNAQQGSIRAASNVAQTDKNFFIQNKGQWNPEVKYLACIGGMNAWITNSGVVYDYYKINKKIDETQAFNMNFRDKQEFENKEFSIEGNVVNMRMVNAEIKIVQTGNGRLDGYYNYFLGNDQNKWASNVPLYTNVELQGIYKNIDVKYYYDNGMLRYDYKAKPGADLSLIKFKFEGQQGISINRAGELVIKTSLGDVTNGKIYAYQMEGESKIEVQCAFQQKVDGTIGLKAESYDAQKELIIDPLIYSTFFGGNHNGGTSIAADAIGNTYITGYAYISDYPVTSGAYQTYLGGGEFDSFITKLNSTGNSLIYSTFIGGNGDDLAYSIAIDANGNAYITGLTLSSNFPTTSAAFQRYSGSPGLYDTFVTKLNSTGSSLVYSTYIGGSGNDKGKAIAVDGTGSAYITGYSNSSNFPTTQGAYKSSGSVTFLAKLNSSGSNLVYSALIAGQASSIAVDINGYAYITGYTTSIYQTTSGAFQTSFGGGYDAFVTKFNQTGSALIYSTFIGGNSDDYGNSIAVDANGYAYITGQTRSLTFPVTGGAYQTNLRTSSATNAFVTKLNPTGTALIYSTYLGGNGQDVGNSIAIDLYGNAYICGSSTSSNYPITAKSDQSNYGGSLDAFVTEFNSAGNSLIYSSYLGGNYDDVAWSIAVDSSLNAYTTGYTNSANYPTTSGAYQPTFGTFQNVFVTKLDINDRLSPASNTLNAANVTFNSSTLNGVINPNGLSTIAQFEYGTTTSYGTTITASQSPITGRSSVNVYANVTGLVPNTLYHYRVKATNSFGTTYGADITFTTLVVQTPPVVSTLSATNMGLTSSTLNGLVNTNGLSSNVQFEYGKTTSYGTTVTAAESPVNSNSNFNVTVNLLGLTPFTLYHFRVKASSSGGTNYGADFTFTTYSNLPTQVIITDDTIFIPGGKLSGGENAGLLESSINADKNANGRINPNRVYALYEGQVYYQLAPIDVNNPTGTLTIVGIPSPYGTTKPIILIQPTAGTDVIINTGAVNRVYGSIKLVNIHYQTMQMDGYQNNELFYCGTANQLPQSLTIDNCLFEFSNIDLFNCTNEPGAIGGWPNGAKFRITNSYFRNMFNAGQWWGSRILNCKHPIDTLWFENCTVTTGGLIFLQQNQLTDFAYFNHNTIVNNKKYWLLSPYYKNLIVTNNIFINQNWVGEDTNVVHSGQDPDKQFISTINIDTVSASNGVVVQQKYYNGDQTHYSSALSLSNLKIFISDNVFYYDPALISGYYQSPTYILPAVGTPPSYLTWMGGTPPFKIQNIPGMWMNARTQALFNAFSPAKGGGFIEQRTTTSNPHTTTPAIANSSVVAMMAGWNQNQWADPRFTTAPDINHSGYIYGDNSPTTLPGKINGLKTDAVTSNGTGVQVGITKFTDLTENFSQSTLISSIDNLPVGSLIWDDAQLSKYNSDNDLISVNREYLSAGGKSIFGTRGDVDGNGGADAFSASLVLKYLVGLVTFNASQMVTADADKDNQVTANDAEWILYATVYKQFPDGSLPKTIQTETGGVVLGRLNSKANSSLIEVPIILEKSQGIHACYFELNIDNKYSDVDKVVSNLPDGWLMVHKYNNGVLKIAMAGISNLPNGTIVTINLKLKSKDVNFDISGLAKLNANIVTLLNSSTVKAIPGRFDLLQNYPNPFNPSTVIKYQLAEDSHVSLVIYDILGQKVKTLVNGLQQAGYYNIVWDGIKDAGGKAASGIYVYKLQSGNFIKTLKMNLLK
jgi:hypothetical protein